MGAKVIICRCPAAPERYDAVLIPGWSAGFVSDGYGIPGARHIRLDAAVDAAALQPHRAAIREGRQMEEKLRALALGSGWRRQRPCTTRWRNIARRR